MSDNHDYLRTGEHPNFRLSAEVLLLMMKGAGYALVFCLAVWFCIAVLAAIGRILPEESRETSDPTPYSFYLSAPQVPTA